MMHFFPEGTFTNSEGHELSLDREENMIVWKKAFAPTDFGFVIVKLEIPKDAAVVFIPTTCRANRAIVLGFYPCAYGGGAYELDMTSATSWYDPFFKYNLGEEISPDCFDRNWRKTCGHGIHFFRNFDEAVQYVF